MLSGRWEQSRWVDNVWTAKIPNFVDDAKSIRIEIETISSGAAEVKITRGDKQVAIDPMVYPSLEAAASASLAAVRHHFQSNRLPEHVLSYTPYRTGQQIKDVLGVAISSSNHWKYSDKLMSRGNVAALVRMMGIFSKQNARGEGEKDTLRLEPAAWDRNDVDNAPIV